MADEDLTPEEVQDKLRTALWFAVGQAVDKETIALSRNATPQFIGALAELVWEQIVTASADLESFSAHASRPGRPTITADDVLLLARRNEDLHGLVKEAMDEVKEVRERRKVEKSKTTKTSKGKEKAK